MRSFIDQVASHLVMTVTHRVRGWIPGGLSALWSAWRIAAGVTWSLSTRLA